MVNELITVKIHLINFIFFQEHRTFETQTNQSNKKHNIQPTKCKRMICNQQNVLQLGSITWYAIILLCEFLFSIPKLKWIKIFIIDTLTQMVEDSFI